jgi:hypothetical protein
MPVEIIRQTKAAPARQYQGSDINQLIMNSHHVVYAPNLPSRRACHGQEHEMLGMKLAQSALQAIRLSEDSHDVRATAVRHE